MRYLIRPALFICIWLVAVNTVDAQSTTSSVYRLINGKVEFLEPFAMTSASPTSAPQPTIKISIKDFPAGFVYDEKLLVADKKVTSAQFTIPEQATTLSITARSRPAGDIFPRMQIRILRNRSFYPVFNGYWQSVALETNEWAIPAELRGKSCVLEFEMQNSGIVEEMRVWYFTRAAFY